MRIQACSGALAALFGATLVTAQAPASLQAPADPRYKSVIDTCKTPPPAPAARGGGPAAAGAGGGRGAAPAAQGPREVAVTEIPGVIAAGQKWTQGLGDQRQQRRRHRRTADGGLLIAQNDNSDGPQAG